MRTRHWIARDPSWDAEPPDGVRLVGADRRAANGLDLPEAVIRRVRTEVEQFRELISSYGTVPPEDPQGRDATAGHA